MRSIALRLLIPIFLLSLSPEAYAANRQAKERTAKKACLAGDPAKGVEILADLYVDTDDITYIFNQGRCFEQNRLYDDAIGRFREYLTKGENRLSSEEKSSAQKHIEACESYLPKKVSPPESPAAVVPLQPQIPQSVPAAQPVTVIEREPTAKEGRGGGGLRAAGIAVGAFGAAALIAGVVLNLKVNSMSSDLEKPDNFNRDTDSTRKDYRTFGWVSYGVGAACVAGGSLLYYLGWHSGRGSSPTVAFAPDLAPTMVGATVKGAF